jgi:hypothetical protein
MLDPVYAHSVYINRRRIGALVGTSRCGVPAREPAGGIATSTYECRMLKQTAAVIAPLNAARLACRSLGEGWTAQRAIPTFVQVVHGPNAG